MNPNASIPPSISETAQRVEFFRLPAPGKRDPHFGLSRGWYYKAADLGEIKMIALRQRNVNWRIGRNMRRGFSMEST